MKEVSTSILNAEKGKEAEIILKLEKARTDYFHIDVMDGKFVEKDKKNFKFTIRCSFDGRRRKNCY